MAEKGNTIKNKIVVEGEKEYKNSLNQIRQALAETRSESRMVKAEFAGQEESVESLQAQIDILTRQYDANDAQCRTLKEYLDKTADAFGENSSEASELRIRLNNARAAMNVTGNELNQLRQRLDAAGSAGEDAGDAFDTASADIDRIADASGEAAPSVGGLADALGELAGTKVGELAVELGGAAGAGKLYVDALRLGDEHVQAWGQLAAYTGATGEELSDMETAAKNIFNDAYTQSIGEAAEAVGQVAVNMGSVGEALEADTANAILLRDTFGWEIPESARTASQLMQTFGVDSETAFNLMARAAQNGADKNGNLLDTLNEYSPYFSAMGKDASDMEAALASAADNGIYDVDKIGDAWKEFSLRLTDGSDTTAEALTALGFNAEDVTRKIAAGGPAADLATQMIIDALHNTEDPYERNRLGVALFGTQWEDTGGKVLDVFHDMESAAVDNRDALSDIDNAKMDNLDKALEGTTNRLKTMFAEFSAPGAQALTAMLQGVNAGIDAGSASVGWDTFLQKGAENMAQQRADLVAQGYTEDEAIRIQVVGMGSDGKPRRTLVEMIQDFFASDEKTQAAAEEGAAASATLVNDALSAAMDEGVGEAAKAYAATHKTNVLSGLSEAYSEVEESATEPWKAFNQALIDSVQEDNVENAGAVGEETALATADAIEAETPAAKAAGAHLGESAVEGLEGTAGDAERAGEEVGYSGHDGLEDGIGDGYGIGANFGASVASGIRAQKDSVYSAAAALGGAASTATKAVMMIHSPSRVGLDIGGNYGGAVAQGIREREEDVALAGEILGRAAEAGTRETAVFAHEGAAAHGGSASQAMDEDAVSAAFRRAMNGMAIQIDGETAGYLLEKGVSIAGYDRAAATVSGRSSGLRI